MSFSKKYLCKYGWEEGQGLGKTKNGIKDAIKPKLKFDKAGIGFDHSQEFTDHWWEKVYNDALNTGNLAKTEDKQRFVKEELLGNLNSDEENKELRKEQDICSLDSVYKACKGRTAHKGARHGLQLSGKLERLEQQERILLLKTAIKTDRQKENSKCDLNLGPIEFESEEQQLCVKSKKKRKHSKHEDSLVLEVPYENDCLENLSKEKKKSKKKHKKEAV